jgi:hypothetical protein
MSDLQRRVEIPRITSYQEVERRLAELEKKIKELEKKLNEINNI